MSVWLCPLHGLFGGQVICPKCGRLGRWALVHRPASGIEALGRDRETGRDAKHESPTAKRDAQ
jgi:hypothetical protein